MKGIETQKSIKNPDDITIEELEQWDDRYIELFFNVASQDIQGEDEVSMFPGGNEQGA